MKEIKRLNIGMTYYHAEENDKFIKYSCGKIIDVDTYMATMTVYDLKDEPISLTCDKKLKVKVKFTEGQISKARMLGCSLFTDKNFDRYVDVVNESCRNVDKHRYNINGYFKDNQVLNLIEHLEEIKDTLYKSDKDYWAIRNKDAFKTLGIGKTELKIPNSNFYFTSRLFI